MNRNVLTGNHVSHASSIGGSTTGHAALSPAVKLHVLPSGRHFESEKIRRRDTGAFL